MHEMGIASSILEAVRKELLLYPRYRAAKVQVRIGEFAGVDQNSLQFCFDSIVKDSSFAPLELGIESVFGDDLDLSYIEMDDGEKETEKETEVALV
jgi:Zn finger protein HypA/HybF involved in hydrogenase expression